MNNNSFCRKRKVIELKPIFILTVNAQEIIILRKGSENVTQHGGNKL